MTKTQIRKLLKEYNIRPIKKLGQNFLIDKNITQKIIKTAELSKKDTVLEIGSGLGNITQELAQKAKKVIAIEKDKKLVEILKENLKDCKNVEIIAGDVLKLVWESDSQKVGSPTPNLKKYKIVANLPFYITSPVIRMFLESDNPPQKMIFLIQKEVAQRICAQVKMNLLAVSVQFYAQPKIIHYVSKTCFWPQPDVDSAIIKITPRSLRSPTPQKGVGLLNNLNNRQKFFQIVKAGFSSPRKQLINNLTEKLDIPKEQIKKALAECDLNIQTRAENLSVEDWINLSSKLS